MRKLQEVEHGRRRDSARNSRGQRAGILLDLANPAIGRLHVLTLGPRILNLQTLPASPSIVPPIDGPSAYLIVMRDESRAFKDFADFVAELGTQLNGSTVMLTFNATGAYDGDTKVVTARSISDPEVDEAGGRQEADPRCPLPT